MELQTKVNIKPSEKKIGYQDKILLLGSCFADNIGAKFAEYYFQTTLNPFGTLYNPASIASILNHTTASPTILYHNGLWHSMMHHGCFSHPDKEELLRRCEQSRQQLQDALNEATTIIVTFGTAWVYEMWENMGLVIKDKFGDWALTEAGRKIGGRMSNSNYLPVPTFELEEIKTFFKNNGFGE